MKAIILTSLLLAASFGAFAQGTVNFSNLSTALSSPPDRLIRFGGSFGPPAPAPGTPASTNLFPGLVAQLYYGASTAREGSLFAVSTAPGTLRASTSASVGGWFGAGTRTLAVFKPCDTVKLQVRVWDISKGADFCTAIANSTYGDIGNNIGNFYGFSAVFTYTVPTNTNPAPSEFNMNNFQGFTLNYWFDPVSCPFVPEPSTFSLAGFGLAALLIFRRRKSAGQ